MEHSLLGKECVILLTKITQRGMGHKAKAARRPGIIVCVWPNADVLVMLRDGTLERWGTDHIALIV